jgi:hypothetical protein
VWEFHEADRAVVPKAADREAGLAERRRVVRVYTVVAPKFLDHLRRPVQGRCAGRRRQPHPVGLPDERAGKRRDGKTRRGGGCLCVVGVLDPEDVARELDDRVLETPSGPEKRDAALAGKRGGRQGALHVPVGARWREKEPIVAR